MQVPYEYLISQNNEYVKKLCDKYHIKKYREKICLMIFIYFEKHNRNSFYKNYLNSLPTKFDDLPHFLKEQDLQILNQTLAFDQISSEKKEFEDLKNYFKSKVVSEISEEELKYLLLVLKTRTYGTYTNNLKSLTISPFADLFNVDVDEKLNINSEFNEKTGDHLIIALKDIKKGEELLDRYTSSWSNTVLFLYWGFVFDVESQDYVGWPELKIKFQNNNCSIILHFPGSIELTVANLFNNCLKKTDISDEKQLLKAIKEDLERRNQSFTTLPEVSIFIYFRKMNFI
jgi:hypothetical protein